MVSSINTPWLYDGVTTLTRGQLWPSGLVSGNSRLSSVHGQPILPGGGGGRSASVGQRTLATPRLTFSSSFMYQFAVPGKIQICLLVHIKAPAGGLGSLRAHASSTGII